MHFHIFDLGSFKTLYLVLLQSLMLLVPQGRKIICWEFKEGGGWDGEKFCWYLVFSGGSSRELFRQLCQKRSNNQNTGGGNLGVSMKAYKSSKFFPDLFWKGPLSILWPPANRWFGAAYSITSYFLFQPKDTRKRRRYFYEGSSSHSMYFNINMLVGLILKIKKNVPLQ